ncbi:hypothetical protein [Microvirga sp. Mcv34]|uniref:hypothetical protein n=1 Tax=Microvirga sp. Mcv34 TaxID=2926016 RepID=UPI0021CABCEF|nr:hypothetical protein [Microvirga sp. Mcv34]
MARKPEDVRPRDRTSPDEPAVDEVHVDVAGEPGQDAPQHGKVHPKVHQNPDEETAPDTTDQPVVEDEP